MPDPHGELVVASYVVVASYEKYLLDQLTSDELAEVMKAFLDHLPGISPETRQALRDSQSPSDSDLD